MIIFPSMAGTCALHPSHPKVCQWTRESIPSNVCHHTGCEHSRSCLMVCWHWVQAWEAVGLATQARSSQKNKNRSKDTGQCHKPQGQEHSWTSGPRKPLGMTEGRGPSQSGPDSPCHSFLSLRCPFLPSSLRLSFRLPHAPNSPLLGSLHSYPHTEVDLSLQSQVSRTKNVRGPDFSSCKLLIQLAVARGAWTLEHTQLRAPVGCQRVTPGWAGNQRRWPL